MEFPVVRGVDRPKVPPLRIRDGTDPRAVRLQIAERALPAFRRRNRHAGRRRHRRHRGDSLRGRYPGRHGQVGRPHPSERRRRPPDGAVLHQRRRPVPVRGNETQDVEDEGIRDARGPHQDQVILRETYGQAQRRPFRPSPLRTRSVRPQPLGHQHARHDAVHAGHRRQPGSHPADGQHVRRQGRGPVHERGRLLHRRRAQGNARGGLRKMGQKRAVGQEQDAAPGPARENHRQLALRRGGDDGHPHAARHGVDGPGRLDAWRLYAPGRHGGDADVQGPGHALRHAEGGPAAQSGRARRLFRGVLPALLQGHGCGR